MSAIYYPLGFLSPAILPAKMIMHELCVRKVSWDQDIPAELAQRFLMWVSDLTKWLKASQWAGVWNQTGLEQSHLHSYITLHIREKKMYGVVTYLHITNKKGQAHCSFIISNSRVSPLKQTTFPRLELTASAVAVKIDRLGRKELQMPQEESVFWSDSTTLLKYIASVNCVMLINDRTVEQHSKFTVTIGVEPW